MDDLLLLACLVGPAVATFALRKTPVYWLPGAMLAIVGVTMLGSIPKSHGDDSVIGAWGSIDYAIEGLFFLVYGLLCLVVALACHRRAIRTPGVPATVEASPIVEIPPAVVVSEAPKI
jgi:tellurite resistance protein TehA-like permease